VLVPERPATAEDGRRWRRLLRHATVDVGPLRSSRDFRLLFAGQLVSFAGSEITYVALPYQAYRLTHSSLVVGLLSVAELVPLLAAALLGGVLADARDRRRLVLLTELGSAVVCGALVANALLPEPRLWPLFVVSALFAVLDGLRRPSLDALVPRIVTPAELPAAAALTGLRGSIGMVLAPPLAGLLITVAGLPGAYTVDVATFAVSLVALALMKAVPADTDVRPGLAAVVEGWRYARSRPHLLGTYLVDITAMFFGTPTALFPAIAARYGGAGVLGLLYAAPPVGALLATLTSGWTGRVHRHGRAIVLAAASWGLAIVGFGFAQSLPAALVFLALAGCADMVSGLFRITMWNRTIPDALRGRLAGIELLSYTTGPLLGNVESGLVADWAGLRFSVVSGGVLCVVGTGLLALALPALWSYDDPG
jgi:MFS family permease